MSQPAPTHSGDAHDDSDLSPEAEELLRRAYYGHWNDEDWARALVSSAAALDREKAESAATRAMLRAESAALQEAHSTVDRLHEANRIAVARAEAAEARLREVEGERDRYAEALEQVDGCAICECVVNLNTPDDLCEVHAVTHAALGWCEECGEFARKNGHAADCTAATPSTDEEGR